MLNSKVKPTHTYLRMISTSSNGLKIRRNWQKNVDKSLLLLIRKHKLTVGFPFDVGAFKVLEPYAGKLACTVLRGRKLPGPPSKKNDTMRRLAVLIQAYIAEKVSFAENKEYICRIICGE
jgi:hypothetical protein